MGTSRSGSLIRGNCQASDVGTPAGTVFGDFAMASATKWSQ
ncbi:hypothetical protein [Arthrobacter methylotrophus]